MKFNAKKIRAFLKKGMQITVKTPVDASTEYEEKEMLMRPGDIGTVVGIKCPVVCILPGKGRRLYDEFVAVKVEIGGRWRRCAVSYDNIQLLGILNYIPEGQLDKFLSDMEDAHSLRWSGIHETHLLMEFTAYDGLKHKVRYNIRETNTCPLKNSHLEC